VKPRAASFGALVATTTLALAGCGKLQGFGGPAPPLASFEVTFSGDLTQLLPAGVGDVHALRLALVWGAQWLTEPFCVLTPESADADAVIKAGCRDEFSFVPLEVGASVPLASAGPTSLVLDALPSADVLVGDITARVAYGSIVVFDDRDDSGTLDLATPQRTASGRGDRQGGGNTVDPARVIYGASFVTMTAPDRRVAYREGGPPTGAFYPRQGCDPPAPGFSVVGAGGFPAAAGLAAALAGQLPAEDPSTCFASAPEATTIDLVAAPPAPVDEVGCDERVQDGSTRYREPPASSPDFTNRQTACAHLPTFDTGGGAMSTLIQLVVSGHPTDQCKGLTHYTLRGCRENVTCPVPDWDYTAAPPAWWPCH
jgi:hypothetical protein